MRSVGGAGIGLLAWMLPGCFPMPPPDPGRPPPPPEMLPAPPPDPPPHPAPRTSEIDLEWDPATRTIRCGKEVELPVPHDLAVYVSALDGDITVVPPGSPPTGSLIALPIDEINESFSFDQLDELQRRLEARANKLKQTIERLHAIAGGWTTDAEIHSDARTGSAGVADVVFSIDDTSKTTWRLAAVHIDGCTFMSLERVRPDAAQRFAPMLQRLCAAKASRCQPSSVGVREGK